MSYCVYIIAAVIIAWNIHLVQALHVVQSVRGSEKTVLDTLRQRGHHALYVGRGRFHAYIPQSVADRMANLPEVQMMHHVRPSTKIMQGGVHDKTRPTVVLAHVIGSKDLAEDAASISHHNFTLQSHTKGHRVAISVPQGKQPWKTMLQLARHPAVVYTSIKTRFRTSNDYLAKVLQSGEAESPIIWDIDELSGDGQTISISDTGVETSGCFFSDTVDVPYCMAWAGGGEPVDAETCRRSTQHRKIAMYKYFEGDPNNTGNSDTSDRPLGHGTHVSGTAAGYIPNLDRNWSNPRVMSNYNGVAYGARLAIDDISADSVSLDPMPHFIDTGMLQPTYDISGARVFSMSWGCSTEGASYDMPSAEVDEFLHSNKDAVALIAAGNEGPTMQTIVTPATAKNAVAVASSINSLEGDRLIVSDFSSKGPTKGDMRIKPDVACPGEYVYSAKSDGDPDQADCKVYGEAGTSMATPACAGVAAIIREYFAKGRHRQDPSAGFNPSGALVKACLIHSARPMEYLKLMEDGSQKVSRLSRLRRD